MTRCLPYCQRELQIQGLGVRVLVQAFSVLQFSGLWCCRASGLVWVYDQVHDHPPPQKKKKKKTWGLGLVMPYSSMLGGRGSC